MNTDNKVQHTDCTLKTMQINEGGYALKDASLFKEGQWWFADRIAEVYGENAKANAEHIVRAWNNHYALLEALRYAQYYLETAINATPTGAIRNILTEANIKALLAIKAAEETT